MEPCKILCIVGGSGAGKTTMAKRLNEGLKQSCVIISQDSYYKDQSAQFDRDGGSVNFDHPDALDFELMAIHIKELKKGNSVRIPIYDFATHKRLEKTQLIEPSAQIIFEGTLLLHPDFLRESFDFKVFIDIDESVRFERRCRRDIEERGRTIEGVKEQFSKQVKPMHDQFVEPTKSFADIVAVQDNFDTAILSIQKKL